MPETEKNELEDYEKRELEILDKLVEKYWDKRNLSIKDFYGFKLKKPFGFHLTPLYLTLPFYKTQIINLHPIESEADFKQYYGVSPEELWELYRKRRVVIILSCSPTRFKGIDYLDSFLERRPPTPCREAAYEMVLSRGRMLEYAEEGEEIFKGKLDHKYDFFLQFTIGTPAIQLKGKGSYESMAVNYYASLMYYGYPQIANKIQQIAKINPELAFSFSNVYYHFLIGPTIASLDGCHPFDRDLLQLKKISDRILGVPAANRKDFFVFPYDVGVALFKNFELSMPNDLNDALEIDNRQWLKALKNLDDTVEKKIADKIPDRADALKESLEEANAAVLSIDDTKKRLARAIKSASVTVSVIGPICTYLTGEGLLWAMLGSSGTIVKEIAEPISEILAKLRKPNHVTAIYNIKKSLKVSKAT